MLTPTHQPHPLRSRGHNPARAHSPAGQIRLRAEERAFTLTELLVVIGLLIFLLAILVPVVSRAMKSAEKTRAAAELAAIGTALEGYKSEFGSYPTIDSFANDPTVVNNLGMAVLAKALVAPGYALTGWTPSTFTSPYQPGAIVRSGGNDYVALVDTTSGPPGADWVLFNTIDGADGPGFRTRRQAGADLTLETADDIVTGPVRGPYVQTDKLKANGMAIITKNGPVLYFPASPFKPIITTGAGFVDATAMNAQRTSLYNANDNLRAFKRASSDADLLALRRVAVMLGDTNYNGRIDTDETARTTSPYLLWAPGDDGKFGPDDPTDLSQVKACDDVISPAQ